MSADWAKPTVSSAYTAFVDEVKNRDLDLALALDPAYTTPTGVPTNAVRWSSAAIKWQKFNGTSWVDLAATYAINISGSAASASAAPWSGITGKPTSVGGYGITDAITTANIGSQSVNYAASAGSAGTATSATTAGSASTAGSADVLSAVRTNWSTKGSVGSVVGLMSWKNYGNGHVIFDASNGTSPDGGAINSTNAAVAWSGTYPTLMGWNGGSTYGVRVDSARVSDSCAGNAATASDNVKFMSTSHNGTYWAVMNWDGTYWNVTTNHGSPVRVGYADSAGGVAWGNVSGRPTNVSSFSNDSGYVTGSGRTYPRRSDGGDLNFYWSGQGGQPTWLWGGNDGNNMYVYNPSNFSVNYAASAGYAGTAGSASTAGALTTATGSAPSYSCRAWVNFNGTGTVAIRASGNVSSITDNGTGDYTVNFTTAMPDANYAVVGMADRDGNGQPLVCLALGVAPTAAACRIHVIFPGVALQDHAYNSIAIFR